MRATEIIRNLLDIIDHIEDTADEVEHPLDAIAIISKEEPVYTNSPDEFYQDLAAVTTDAGLGGTNGPKNPADIRSDSVSMFPAHQHKMGE